MNPNTVNPNTAPGNTVPGNTAPGNTVPGNTVPENTVPENTVPENVTPENVARDAGATPVPSDRSGELPAGRVTDVRAPTEDEVEAAADVVETSLAAWRSKVDRATRGVLSALLALEALVVLLVPRAIAQTHTGLDTTKTVILVGLAVVMLLGAVFMRRRWGVGMGSALQVALLVTGVLASVMIVIALVFIGLWLWVLTMRRGQARTSGGLRMLVS